MALFASEIAELVLYGIGITSCIVLIIQLVRSLPFHIHLWILMMNLIICTLTFSLFRVARIIVDQATLSFSVHENYQSLKDALQMIRLVGLSAGCASLLAIFVERLWATIHVSIYENIQYVLFPIASVLSSWVFWSILIYLLIKRSVTETFIYGFDVAINLVSLVGLIALMLYQTRMHQRSKLRWVSSHTHNLSEQYQLKENLRCSLLLIPLILVYTINSIVCLVAIELNSFSELLSLEVFNAVYNLTAGVLSIAVPLFIGLIIFISKMWFILLPARLKRDSKIFDAHSSFDLHFESLNKIWEETDPATIKHAGEALKENA